jgi:hypothetical protein
MAFSDLTTMRIEFLSPEAEIDPKNDNVDVLLHLDDGRSYTFVVATPNNIYWCMDNEGNDYFFGQPPLFVRRLTRESVERALGVLLKEPRWLEVYGSLQIGDSED